MIRHVERDHADPAGDVGIIENMAPLPAVGPGRVQAQERHPFASLFVVDTILDARMFNPDIAAANSLKPRHHHALVA